MKIFGGMWTCPYCSAVVEFLSDVCQNCGNELTFWNTVDEDGEEIEDEDE